MPNAPKANADSNNAASSQSVGEQIRDLRKTRTLTLQGLADKIGRPVGYVLQIERNISDVSNPVLKEIAEAFDVNINWLFQGNANAPAGEREYVVRVENRRRLDFAGTGLVEELCLLISQGRSRWFWERLRRGPRRGLKCIHARVRLGGI